jgi:hypothetical protein
MKLIFFKLSYPVFYYHPAKPKSPNNSLLSTTFGKYFRLRRLRRVSDQYKTTGKNYICGKTEDYVQNWRKQFQNLLYFYRGLYFSLPPPPLPHVHSVADRKYSSIYSK